MANEDTKALDDYDAIMKAIDAKDAEIASLQQQLTDCQASLRAVEAERVTLIEDRARFPGKPDDIGRMIEAHIGNLKAAKKSSDDFANQWHSRMMAAEARVKLVRAETIEECAKVCEQQAKEFLSPEYASYQPASSLSERFACKECATAIRALGQTEPGEQP